MGCLPFGNGFICGNFNEVLPQKPENFGYDQDAKWMEPYPPKWKRRVIGKTTCDCKQIETHFQPWYGYSWYHSNDCALMKRVEARPGLLNLPAFYDVEVIGYSE